MNMSTNNIKDIVNIIASFLVSRTGNDIFDKQVEKRKIRKVLKEDKKNIQRLFGIEDDTDLYNLIEEFVMNSAFKDTLFYSSMELTLEQENELWERFSKYIEKETKDGYVNIDYKSKIIRCINLHNEAINNIIMDTKSNIHIKLMQRQYENFKNYLDYIISTLNTDTKLLDNDDELNFVIEQIETIMKSYRFDINQTRKMQIISICGTMIILLILTVSIPLSLKYVESIYTIYALLIFLVVFLSISYIFWLNISNRLRCLERKMENMRDYLLHLHLKLYESILDKKYGLVYCPIEK